MSFYLAHCLFYTLFFVCFRFYALIYDYMATYRHYITGVNPWSESFGKWSEEDRICVLWIEFFSYIFRKLPLRWGGGKIGIDLKLYFTSIYLYTHILIRISLSGTFSMVLGWCHRVMGDGKFLNKWGWIPTFVHYPFTWS